MRIMNQPRRGPSLLGRIKDNSWRCSELGKLEHDSIPGVWTELTASPPRSAVWKKEQRREQPCGGESLRAAAKWSQWSVLVLSPLIVCAFGICVVSLALYLWEASQKHTVSVWWVFNERNPRQAQGSRGSTRHPTSSPSNAQMLRHKVWGWVAKCQMACWIIKGMSGRKQGSWSRAWHLVNNLSASIH